MTKTAQTTPPAEGTDLAEFPVTLGEFLTEVPKSKAETKAAFTQLCRQENITGNKQRSEWATLLELFVTMPTAAAWNEWQSKGGK